MPHPLPGGSGTGIGGPFGALLDGAAQAPFLAGLMVTERAWLDTLAGVEPEGALAALLVPVVGPAEGALRARRRRVALLVALADLGGVWTLAEVTGALTAFADFAVQTALAAALEDAVARRRLPPATCTDGGGFFVLAMGKLGAGELNYSSDIDLICLFDETRHPPGAYADIRQGFVRVVQGMVRILSAQTGEGYVLRTDLRLRPDASVTPVCIGAGVAERYYETLGRTWERAAMIKARPCAGDIAAGEAFLDALTPFLWRRHLDFAAIEDIHDIQRRIRAHKGLEGPLSLPGHDVKLGRGGIRAIEFFVQTRQLICGGRDRDLRGRATVPMLGALAARGWVAGEVADALAEDYEGLRALEHRIQMLEDAQTHVIPRGEPARRRLAALFGTDDLPGWEGAVTDRLGRVERLTAALFAIAGGQAAAPVEPEGMGYTEPDRARALVERWQGGGIPATRSARARAILGRIAPEILRRLARAASPDEALVRFDHFLSGLPAGIQILSLFEANPQLLDLLAEICAASPRLAAELSRHAGVLDAVLSRGFFDPLPGRAALETALSAELIRAGDYERVLDAARTWDREQRFRAGVQLLRGISDAAEVGGAFSDIAEAALRALLPHVEAEVARRFGPAPGRGAVVLALGKFGSREMTIASDLDLIVIYDAPPGAVSGGARPLAAPTYYARLTQTLVSALSAPTAQGTLYDVDMRLRPSGRKGPVAVGLSGFATYQRTEAWAWEHLALTRARVVAGHDTLAAEVEAEIAAIRGLARPRAPLMAEVRAMRTRLARAHAGAGAAVWEVKHGPGGMLDIELALQAGLLAMRLTGPRSAGAAIAPLVAAGYLTEGEGAVLRDAHGLQSRVQHLARLSVAGAFTPRAAGAGLVAALIRAGGVADLSALAARLDTLTRDAARVVDAVLAR